MYNLTIIIPHFNSPELLEKLLETIPEKDDIQTIVIDDNSTKYVDEYDDVVRKYSERVEFYKNTTGVQSAGACRNIGLDHAEGKWLMFADSDDYFMPDMYESVCKYFDSDEEMVIFCPTSVFLDTGELADRHVVHANRVKNYLQNPTYENLIQVKRMKAPWSKMILKSIVDENKIRFSDVMHSNDMYFTFVAGFYCKKTAISGDIIYCITRSSGSLTTKANEKAYDLFVQETIKCYKFGKEHYSKKDLELFNINGALLLFQGYKRKLGMKKIIQTYGRLRKNDIPLLSREMRNPLYTIKALTQNNKMIDKEKSYYVK
jgi:glycosyltransferase involved in cell wall biosynthesis